MTRHAMEINYQAWAENMIAFIRERGMEGDFKDWSGGFPCPVPTKDDVQISDQRESIKMLNERTGRALEALIKPDDVLARVPNTVRDALRELISDLHLMIEDWIILYERQARISARERRLAFEQCATEARRYASFYSKGTDPRNTFMMMAENFDRRSQQ